MTVKAEINKDSIGPSGKRITTFVLKYPRFIHAEFLTHRMFSRNASSSRAIPFSKQVTMIEKDTAVPLSFRANQKGMQAGQELDNQKAAYKIWERARDAAIEQATALDALGAHKQYVNRIIEPFSHITVVCTATEFNNFFALRHHSMAQPEIAELAKQMWELYKNNVPEKLKILEWHLPFINYADRNLALTDKIKRSVARCARVSYNNHDGSASSFEADLHLYNRLVGSQPIHASCAEHQAKALGNEEYQSGNFFGWEQYRKTLKHENITEFKEPLG